MTEREAIKSALELLPQMRDSQWVTAVGQVTAIYTDEAKEAFNVAIAALEKQETAKIVIGKSKGGATLWHECSKCGEPVDAKDTYCSGCGRKLIYENE